MARWTRERLAAREDGVKGVLAAHRGVVEGFGREAQAAVPDDGCVQALQVAGGLEHLPKRADDSA